MAHADRPAPSGVSASRAPRVAAWARCGLADAEMRAAAASLTRAQWRALRRVLRWPEAPAVLQALRNDQQARRRKRIQPPEPWTLAEALAALAAAHQATLFGALRLLQAAQPAKHRLGYALNPDLEPVRIDQPLVLGYVGNEVTRVSPPTSRQIAGRARVQQAAVGLLGPNGPLPFAWTLFAQELASASAGARKGHERDSFLAFLNVLQHRQFGFLFRAWSDAEAVTALDPAAGDDRHPVAGRLLALAGMAHAELAARDHVPPEFKQAFAAPLSRRVRNPAALAGMLAAYLDVQVHIEEFVPRWLDVPQAQQSTLGERFSELGTDAVVGHRVWNCDSRFRIVVGPMPLARYHQLLPGGAAHREASDLVALYAGPEMEWEIRLVLQADEVPQSLLAAEQPRPSLGWTTWLGTRPEETDAADLGLHTAAELAPRAAAPALLSA